MFESLFGSEMPLAARFFIAFLVVLGLIGLTAWLVRRFGASRLGGANARGRQPRLAVIDAATVDARRRLVLIRRDNIEHLLMIGGPTDVVVEQNIVRAAGRETGLREPGRIAPDTAARPAETAWPLQPSHEPAPAATATARAFRATEEPWLAPEPGARPRPAESFGEVPPRLAPDFAPARPEPTPPRAPVVTPPPAEVAAPQTDHSLAEMAMQLEAALRRAPAPEGRPPVTDPLVKPAEPRLREFKPRVEPKFVPNAEPKAEVKPEPRFEPKSEPKLDMPKFEPKFEPKPEPRVEAKPEIKPEPKSEPKSEPKLDIKPEPKAPLSGKDLYDNLEEEMASLLGRPSGKS